MGPLYIEMPVLNNNIGADMYVNPIQRADSYGKRTHFLVDTSISTQTHRECPYDIEIQMQIRRWTSISTEIVPVNDGR